MGLHTILREIFGLDRWVPRVFALLLLIFGCPISPHAAELQWERDGDVATIIIEGQILWKAPDWRDAGPPQLSAKQRGVAGQAATGRDEARQRKTPGS